MIALASGANASAQTSTGRLSFGGTAGFGQTWDDEGSIGKGWLGGGYADVRLFEHTDFEVAVDALTHNREGRFQAHGHTTFLSGTIVQRFGSRATNGYVLGGLTLAAHKGTAGFPEENLVHHTDSTHHGLIFGGGFVFRAGRRLEVGPVVRMTLLSTSTDSDVWSTIMTGFRIGFAR